VNSACTVDLFDRGPTSQAAATGFWRESPQRYPEKAFDLSGMPGVLGRRVFPGISTMTSITDWWSKEQSIRDAVVTLRTATNKMLIDDLGWTREQAHETRLRLRAFEEDWSAPGMERYDEL